MTQLHPLSHRLADIRQSLQTPHVPLALRLAGLRPVIEALAWCLLHLFDQLEVMFARWQAGLPPVPARPIKPRQPAYSLIAYTQAGRTIPSLPRTSARRPQAPARAVPAQPRPLTTSVLHQTPRRHHPRLRVQKPVPQWPPRAA